MPHPTSQQSWHWLQRFLGGEVSWFSFGTLFWWLSHHISHHGETTDA
ncbi:hypothetical protein AO364_1536 [Moraxella catarrhalis]|nr:hypothetical protein AO380_1421 [Moraxella catarrhalis]OAV35702.1 hypothetical protein AO364_1536 [Moraxella catarrhalis]